CATTGGFKADESVLDSEADGERAVAAAVLRCARPLLSCGRGPAGESLTGTDQRSDDRDESAACCTRRKSRPTVNAPAAFLEVFPGRHSVHQGGLASVAAAAIGNGQASSK